MPVTNYYTIDGEIIGEKTTGGSRVDYLTDALGSVTVTVDQSAQVVNAYRYKPYGTQLSKTGVAADPAFQWVGTRGYRQTGRQYSETYVRARHYSSALGAWTTQDPIRSRGGWNYYGYVQQSPTVWTDPSGLIFDPISCGACIGVGVVGLSLLLACVKENLSPIQCLCEIAEQMPWLIPIMMGVGYVACSICIPGLGTVLVPGEGGALAGGIGALASKRGRGCGGGGQLELPFPPPCETTTGGTGEGTGTGIGEGTGGDDDDDDDYTKCINACFAKYPIGGDYGQRQMDVAGCIADCAPLKLK